MDPEELERRMERLPSDPNDHETRQRAFYGDSDLDGFTFWDDPEDEGEDE